MSSQRTPATKALAGRPARAAWSVSDGSLEALKWVALVLMAADHLNKYLLHESSTTLYALGRMVMPVFGFVLMYNLARPGALANGLHVRVMKRLGIVGGVATPAFVHLVGWWPLNILFTLLVATVLAYLLERGGRRHRLWAALGFILGGAVVEFWWPALLCCLGAWAFVRKQTAGRLLLWVLGTASLAILNGNFAALAALGLIWGFAQVDIALHRNRWIFYAFYPAHLTVLALHVATR